MSWLRLQVAATPADAEATGKRLEQAGAIAISLLPAESARAVIEPDLDHAPLWDAVRVQALLPPAADLGEFADLHPEVDFVPDRDWSETWRAGFGPQRFGRLVVAPRDADVDAAEHDAVVRLDPGLAFGTGTHPSTALCLDWLARQALAGRSVLDVGSGSGILGIAALHLGADAVVAVDRDPQARLATASNAAANGVQIEVVEDMAAVTGSFDIAVANIVSNTLRAMAPTLAACAETVVLAGLLDGQLDEVRQAFAALRFEPPRIEDGWALLCGRHDHG